MTTPRSTARRALLGAALLGPALVLAGCNAGSGIDPLRATPPAPRAAAPPPAPGGPVRVALILPLGAGGPGAAVAQGLRNAAEMALAEFDAPTIALDVRDDGGTAGGADAAARAALGEGAELVVGPLFAPAVAAAGAVARPAGRPVLAFSTDATVAAPGVYLLGFLPATEVERVVSYAAGRGRGSFAALVPEGAYGNVVAAEFQQVVARRGARLTALERYAPGGLDAAAARVAAGAPDAVLLPMGPDDLGPATAALNRAGLAPGRAQLLGTGLWNDPRALALPALRGAWFPAPDGAGFAAFSARYRARYNAEPPRIATLAYDAVALAAALAKTQGGARFTEGVLTNPSGYAGQDGVFRLRPDGTSERGLAVLEVGAGAARPISPAPRTFGASGT